MGSTALVLTLACGYALLAMIDGLWIHFVRLGLHRNPNSRREHGLHTARAALFPGILLLVVNPHAAGAYLWFGVVLTCIDFALVAWDAAEETTSRKFMRGLPAYEASLHTVLQALHAVLMAAALLMRPSASWWASGALGFPGGWPGLILGALVAGGVAVFGLHALLAWTGRKDRDHPRTIS